MRTGVRAERYGVAPDGTPLTRFTLASPSGVEAVLLSFGATLARVRTPDRAGMPGDVVLGFDEPVAWAAEHPHFGGVIGRFANRIAHARFTLHGRVVELAANEPPHHLHGGFTGFDRRAWRAQPFEAAGAAGVELRLTSPDGEEGYPGTLEVVARYTLAANGELRLELSARSDAATVVSLTQHAYFNLADAGAGDVLGHTLELDAEAWCEVDRERIPTGRLVPVAGGALDFRTGRSLRDVVAATPGGIDHCFALRARGAEPTLAARLHDPRSGRTLELATTAPGLQIYTGNGLDGRLRGRGGVAYRRHAGVCLEAQGFPDAPNQPAFPSAVLEPGRRWLHQTVFRWGVR